VGRKSHRSVSAVVDAVGGIRVRALFAAILLVLAIVAPALAAASLVHLTDASSSPTSGTTTTEFTFTVVYHNQGRVAPSYVRVNVGGSTHGMQATSGSTDWRAGVAFSVTTRLPAGTWHPAFEAADKYGSTGSDVGPTVTVQGPAPTPTPTPRPTPTPTPRPTPTPTPRPTPTPTPTPRPTPTPTPAPTPTPKPTATPTPTPKPTPKPTPAPTPTPKPTTTPSPKPTATPGPTPRATPAPTPGATPRPTSAPTSAPTQRPTANPTPQPTLLAGASPASNPSASGVPGGTTPAPDPSSGTPSASGGALDGASPSPSSQIAVVVPPPGPNGSVAGSQGAGGGSGNTTIDTPSGGGSGGSGNAALFGGPSTLVGMLARLAPTMVVTTGGVAMAMAFLAFGRRRRDESPTAPDAVLAAAAASGMATASRSNLVPAAVLGAEALAVTTAVRAATVAPATLGPVDADIPRWRRQSLIAARKADPLRSVHTSVNLTFSGQASEAVSGLEHRRIRYRLVSLLDQPDDVRGVQIGSLDEGDEVVLLERLGTYWRVLCPDGREGWVHKMVLAAPTLDDPPPMAATMDGGAPVASSVPGGPATLLGAARPNPNPAASWTAADDGPAPGSFEDVLRMYSERRQQLGDA